MKNLGRRKYKRIKKEKAKWEERKHLDGKFWSVLFNDFLFPLERV